MEAKDIPPFSKAPLYEKVNTLFFCPVIQDKGQDHSRLSALAYVFLFLLSLAFFSVGLTTLPPTDRDESSFAQATKQMIQGHNYIDIRFQDKPRYKKPIGIYWLQAASVRLLNPTHLNEIWAYRIPSLLGATASVLLTAALGSLLFGARAGFLAALMMAGCVLLNVEARLAKTDAMLLACILATQLALAKSYLGPSRWPNALLFWTALGAGILIKGPIILLVVLSTLLWLRFSDKNLTWFSRLKPWGGLPYLLFLVTPWFVTILWQSHGAFLAESAGHDLFGKFWQGQDRGILPPGLHLLAFLVVFFPFSLFAFLAAPDAWKNRVDPATRFCLGWILPAWIVFELSLTKLPHYVLPLYPAVAMLTAKAAQDGFPALAERGGRWLFALLFALWLMIGMAFALGFGLLPYLMDHVWNIPQLGLGFLLILLQGVALFYLPRQPTQSLITLTLASLLFFPLTFGHTLPSLKRLWPSLTIVALAQTHAPCPTSPLMSLSYYEPSLVFLNPTDTTQSFDGATLLSHMRTEPCLLGLVDAPHEDSFQSALQQKKQRAITLGTVEGFNVGNGHAKKMTLYTLTPERKIP